HSVRSLVLLSVPTRRSSDLYRVPADMDADAVPGCRVRVRFNNRKLSGFLVERVATSEFSGRLAYLDAVVSPEPVLTPEILELARVVADRYVGTLSDVLRLAVPPRHARVEKEEPFPDARGLRGSTAEEAVAGVAPGPWEAYPEGPVFLDALRAGRPARAVWNALPGPGWKDAIAAV